MPHPVRHRCPRWPSAPWSVRLSKQSCAPFGAHLRWYRALPTRRQRSIPADRPRTIHVCQVCACSLARSVAHLLPSPSQSPIRKTPASVERGRSRITSSPGSCARQPRTGSQPVLGLNCGPIAGRCPVVARGVPAIVSLSARPGLGRGAGSNPATRRLRKIDWGPLTRSEMLRNIRALFRAAEAVCG